MSVQNNSSGYPLPFSRAFPPPVLAQRSPTTSDVNYPIGQEWVDESGPDAYILVEISSASATWEAITGASGISTLNGDSGSATGATVTLLGGTGISTIASGATVTFNTVGAGLKYQSVGTNTSMTINSGYINTGSGAVVQFLLPATAPLGSVVEVVGLGTSGWQVTQNAGQVIHFNSVSTAVGTGGSLASTARYNTVKLVCVVANTDWVVNASEGTITVT